ncbi:MAG TPA: hypothetical protein VGE63_00560 [Candidatus Paceibacterota bacterium]
MTKNDVLKVALLCGALLIVSAIWLKPSSQTTTPTPINPTASETTKLCFYRETGTTMKDIAWLTLTINNTATSGEFHILPAEKDKKIGPYTGTIESNPTMAAVRATWTASAEGMTNPEELIFVVDAEGAHIGFGGMKDRGDGTYVYIDTKNLTYMDLPPVDCAQVASLETKM